MTIQVPDDATCRAVLRALRDRVIYLRGYTLDTTDCRALEAVMRQLEASCGDQAESSTGR